YASADATPLFLVAMNDYVRASGDIAFASSHWDNVWRAYQFLKSTYDANGLPRNFGIGHGWVEGGPLLPVETESYQSGLATAALDAIASLARDRQRERGRNFAAGIRSAQKEDQRFILGLFQSHAGLRTRSREQAGPHTDSSKHGSDVVRCLRSGEGERHHRSSRQLGSSC